MNKSIPTELGRPTKYDPEYVEQVYRLSLLGMTDKELATHFDVDEKTINNWKKNHCDFFQSLKAGKAEADTRVAEALYQQAIGGNVTAAIFWLKNRQREKWRDGKRLELESAGGNHELKSIHEISDEELMAIAMGGNMQDSSCAN
jgi:DNA-binding XRE family transcriptional regulator